MLALKTVLGRADETPTLIFDEIDQGIGGRVGVTVGRKLWGLTACGDGRRHPAPGAVHHPPAAAGRLWRPPFPCRQANHRATHLTNVQTLSGIAREELADMMGAASEAGRASVLEI